MAVKRLTTEKQRAKIKKDADALKALKAKGAASLNDADIKKLVIAIARRLGLLD
jgi:hypothetical protein